jgi:hypothetical protein
MSTHRPLPGLTDSRIRTSAFEYCRPLKKVYQYVAEHPNQGLSLVEAAGIALMCRRR